VRHFIKEVVVEHNKDWGCWPDTKIFDYPKDARDFIVPHPNGKDEIVVQRISYPVYIAFATDGGMQLPIEYEWIDNTKEPEEAVKQRMINDLNLLSQQCDTILWDHAKNCYPDVAKHIPDLFELSILPFADDCPGSSEIKTFPVAKYFDALFYQMKVWDFKTGIKTADKYAEVAPNLTPYFKGQNESFGLMAGIENQYFQISNKASAIRSGYMPVIDFVFLGYRAWHWRGDFCDALNAANFGDLRSKLHGKDMRDGLLGDGPGGACGVEASKLYTQSLIGVNPQVSSIFNGRLIDLWECGVVQMVYDPHGELESEGFVDGEHYVSFDGSVEDCISKAHELRADPNRCADIIERAHAKMREYQYRKSTPAVYGQIYADYIDGKIGRKK
jgi:hypothetical protein